MSSAIGYQQADSLDVKLANDLGEGRWVDGLYFPATTNVTEWYAEQFDACYLTFFYYYDLGNCVST